MIRTDNHARQRHKTLNVIMKLQQDRQSNGNKSESAALNKTGATTSRQVQLEAVDNTSHPGRPVLDELVPSRYALKVGEIDVLVVSDGVLSLPGAMLGHNVDPAVRAAWLEDMFLQPDVLERSEEHTSELQSHLNLVCRLLLEKKKTQLLHRPDGRIRPRACAPSPVWRPLRA